MKNVSFLFVEKLLQLASIAIVNIFILRALGPEDYGTLSAATAMLAIALPLANFGALSIIRELSIGKTSDRKLVVTAVTMSAVASLICLLVLLLLGRSLFAGSPTGDALIILAFVFLAKPFAAVDTWFQAKHLNHVTSAVRMVVLIVVSTARLAVALFSPSIETLALLIVVENTLIALSLLVAYLIALRARPIAGGLNPVPIKDIFTASWPLLASGLAVILYMRIDQPMLLWLAGSESVGLYSAAANLADAVSFIPVIMSTVLLPGLISLYSSKRRQFILRFTRALELGAGLGYMMMIGGLLLGPLIVDFLYGLEFSSAGRLVQILFCSAPFVFIGVIQNSYVIAFGLQKYILFTTSIAIVINVSANFLVIPIYGASGAAVTTVIAHAIGGVFGNAIFPETRVLFVKQCRALNPFSGLLAVSRFVMDRRL